MVKRILLIILIISMCIVVAIGGNITLVNSHSILKKQANLTSSVINNKVFIDVTENRLYVMKNDAVVKSYPISTGMQNMLSPIGMWKVQKMSKEDKSTGGYFIGIDIPWGVYGICSTDMKTVKNSNSQGFIKMFNDDVEELYKIVDKNTPVQIYGGPYGPFGNGFRRISPGDRGADVYEIEKRLKTLGYYGGNVNGIYDDNLKTAIHKYQKHNRLQTSDSVGSDFYIKLGINLME